MLLKRTIFLIPALLLMFASTANAHGPVRGKMTASVIIDAPAEKVWDVVKDYGDLSWLPLIKNTKADKGNKKGSVRVLTLKDGGTITEELKAYKPDKMSYKYKITDMSSVKTIKHSGKDEEIPVLPVENYAATISVSEKGGKSEVKWVATYYRAYVNNNPPEELNEAAADKAVTAVLTSGLTSLLQKFDSKGKESAVKFKMKR
ncbi:MAG: SRPBCC family protein [Methylococcales bacterium]|nr:SRPBCC family protein [Methylococcales bacterium]